MTDISHRAPLHASGAALITRRPSTSRQIERPRHTLARHDPVAMDWRPLRTIVDALLRRAAAAEDDATAIAATHMTPEEQEPIHG